MKYILTVFLILAPVFPLLAEDPYADLFDRIYDIEEELRTNPNPAIEEKIDELRTQVNNSPYDDLKTRMRIIGHLLDRKDESLPMTPDLDYELETIERKKKLAAFDAWTIAGSGLSLVSMGTLIAGLILADAADSQYLSSATIEDSLYFKKVRDGFDISSLISSGVFIVGISGISVLAALRPQSLSQDFNRGGEDRFININAYSPDARLQKLIAARSSVIDQIEIKRQKRTQLKPWKNITLYGGIGCVTGMAVFLALGVDAYYRYNLTLEPELISRMETWSNICEGLSIGLGIAGGAAIASSLIIEDAGSDASLQKELYDLDLAIINFQ